MNFRSCSVATADVKISIFHASRKVHIDGSFIYFILMNERMFLLNLFARCLSKNQQGPLLANFWVVFD